MSSSTQWNMLKDGLRESIEALPEYRVSHALFTTYSFEPEFFETSILPLLLPDGSAGLSLHSTLRRMQMETLLRQAPIDIDVYFDARVVLPGCPLLPYNMLPVRLKNHEFHGKVILLALVNESGDVRCVLGAGSANLTKAGWWENIEAWHFTESFDPTRPPNGLLPSIPILLEFLSKPGTATKYFSSLFDSARPLKAQKNEPVFGVFTPDSDDFLRWLEENLDSEALETPLEVISPYFAESGHNKLAQDLLKAAGSKKLNLWLPDAPWSSNQLSTAAIKQTDYDKLSAIKALSWSHMKDPNLARSRQQDAVPRTLHAKLIRKPGCFSFMGSVNFSNKACRSNFEAGFLFTDRKGPWLEPTQWEPEGFINPVEQACHENIDDGAPEMGATFNWKTQSLTVRFLVPIKNASLRASPLKILDAQGLDSGIRIIASTDINVDTTSSLYVDLQTIPWIRLQFPDGLVTLAWIQQEALDYRPPPIDLESDVWRILEMWRTLAGGDSGSMREYTQSLEIILKQRSNINDEEEILIDEPERDLFEEMSAVHGSFYLLRQRLQKDRDEGNKARCEYYLSAPRPDTLSSLLDRIDPCVGERVVDPVTEWVMLHWVLQICDDHPKIPSTAAIRTRAEKFLNRLLQAPPLAMLVTQEPKFFDWARRMFLCKPGQEHKVSSHFDSVS